MRFPADETELAVVFLSGHPELVRGDGFTGQERVRCHFATELELEFTNTKCVGYIGFVVAVLGIEKIWKSRTPRTSRSVSGLGILNDPNSNNMLWKRQPATATLQRSTCRETLPPAER